MASLDQTIAEVIAVLRSGGIILYPTDTVWGIGCDATNAEAVEKIYALKGNTDKKSMLVLCNTPNMIVKYVNKAPAIAFEVMEMSEKPLTAILPGAAGLAPNLIPEEKTLGVRIPAHEFCERLLYKFGRPIVSTSANTSGELTPQRFNEIEREIVEGVDYVVHPRFEGKPTRRPSSIIAFGQDSSITIIRD